MATLTFTGRDRYTTLRGTTDDEVMADEAEQTVEDDCVLLIQARDWRRVMNSAELVARILDLVDLGRADEVGDFVPILVPRHSKT